MSKAMTVLFLMIALSIPALAAGSAAEDYRHAMSLLIGNNQDTSDQDTALELLHSSADRGYAPSQTAMGAIYEERGSPVTGYSPGNPLVPQGRCSK